MKDQGYVYLTVLGLLAVVLNVQCQSGFRVTVSEVLLKNINQMELGQIKNDLTKQTFPDLSEGGDLSYTISNIKLSKVGSITSDLELQTGNVINWRADLSSITIKANWNVKYIFRNGLLDVPMSLSGSVEATARSTAVSLRISLGISPTNNGQLKISLASCSSSIGNLELNFGENLINDVLNDIVDPVTDYFKRFLEQEICPVVQDVFKHSMVEMNSLETQYEVGLLGIPFILDNQFIDIRVGSNSLTSYQKGAIKWNDLVFESRTMTTDLAVSSANLSFDLQDDVINNLLQAVVAAGVLNGNISYSRVVENNMREFYLNCPEGVLCAGSILQDKVANYTDGVLGVNWAITKANLTISPDRILGSIQGNMNFTAETTHYQYQLFGAAANLTVPFQAKMSENDLTVKPTAIGGTLTIDSSRIGKILDEGLQNSINSFFIGYVEKELLKMFEGIETSFPIQLPDGISFRRNSVKLYKGVVRVEADVCYKQTCKYDSTGNWTGKSDSGILQIIDILPTPTTTTSPSANGVINGDTSGQGQMFSMADICVLLLYVGLCHMVSRTN